MEYREQGVRVSPCRCGLGVFSLRAFAAHELIGPICGTVIDDSQYQSEYCMELGCDSALEPASPFRYVNHSCHPNCSLVELQPDAADVADEVLWLEALEEISPGEQLTIDYAWPAWAAVPCVCGCAECRGWIVSEEDRDNVGSPASRARAVL